MVDWLMHCLWPWCHLDIVRCDSDVAPCPQALCKVVRDMKVLKLSGCYNVGSIALGAIGKGCPQLEQIVLSLCPKVNAIGLGALTAGCKSLTNLNLRGCDHVEDDSLRAIAKHAPQLITINLSGEPAHCGCCFPLTYTSLVFRVDICLWIWSCECLEAVNRIGFAGMLLCIL